MEKNERKVVDSCQRKIPSHFLKISPERIQNKDCTSDEYNIS